MIELKNISVTFNAGQPTEIVALKDVSCSIPDKQFVVLIGANGSGKSTLLNVISGTANPQKGAILLDGDDVTEMPEYRRAKYISRVFQNPLTGTAPEMSILDNFRLAALRTQRKGFSIGTNKIFEGKVKEKIAFLKLGLENNIYKSVGSLSGGQRQALTLVMGIMDECKIMLLDEPTAALDPRSAHLVMEKAEEIISDNKLTAVMVTHNLKDALQYGDRLLMLKEGKVMKDVEGAHKKQLSLDEIGSWFLGVSD